MLKMISAAYHMNIGDRRGSLLLKSYIESWFGVEVDMVGYQIPWTEDRIEDLLYNCDGIILGPGGVILESANYTLLSCEPANLFQRISVPMISMAAGFNINRWPPESWRANLKSTFGAMDLIGLRTGLGRDLATKLGFKSSYSPDPLLFVGDPSMPVIKDKVIVSWHYDFAQAVYKLYSEFLADKYDVVEVYHDKDNILNVADYADCDFVVTDRFHGCVLAAAYGKPFITFDFNTKLLGIASDFGIKDVLRSDALDEDKFGMFLAHKERIRKQLPQRLASAKRSFADFMIKVGQFFGR